MNLLLIEDQTEIAELLCRGLEEASFHVTVAADGEVGLHRALERRFAAIILDLLLPVRDGWSVCQELRRRRVTTPILMLTARDAIADRVRGLQLGADDYLIKPFDFEELVARVQALIRRDRIHKGRVIRVGDLEVDTITRVVTRAGRRLGLTDREYTLLEAMAAHEGEVLSRERILEQVWLNEESYSNTVDAHIKGLRKKLDADHAVRLIHTVYGQGYTLEARNADSSGAQVPEPDEAPESAR